MELEYQGDVFNQFLYFLKILGFEPMTLYSECTFTHVPMMFSQSISTMCVPISLPILLNKCLPLYLLCLHLFLVHSLFT